MRFSRGTQVSSLSAHAMAFAALGAAEILGGCASRGSPATMRPTLSSDGPAGRRCDRCPGPQPSEGPDVLGLRSLVATDRGVLDTLVLLQASVAVGFDRGVMDEYILRSIVGRDKAVALVRVEPFHCSLSHCGLLPERSAGSTGVHPGVVRPPVPPWEGSGTKAPAVRIRRRCDTSTKFHYNHSHLTPSRAPPLQRHWRRVARSGVRARLGRGGVRVTGPARVADADWQRPIGDRERSRLCP
jgi:hypothetical protein